MEDPLTQVFKYSAVVINKTELYEIHFSDVNKLPV
jgi:hypothetical protein